MNETTQTTEISEIQDSTSTETTEKVENTTEITTATTSYVTQEYFEDSYVPQIQLAISSMCLLFGILVGAICISNLFRRY